MPETELFQKSSEQLYSKEIATVFEAISFLKEAIAFAYQADEEGLSNEHLKPLLDRVQGRYFSSITLYSALVAVLSKLLGEESNFDATEELAIEPAFNFVDGSSRDLMMSLDLAFCYLALGKREALARLLGLFQKLMDQDGSCFLPLWVRADNFSEAKVDLIRSLLLGTPFPDEVDPFYKWIWQKSDVPEPLDVEVSGAVIEHRGGISSAFTTCGVGTGLGAICASSVSIQAFGPLFDTNPEDFGIWNPTPSKSGWIRSARRSETKGSLFALEPSRDWIQCRFLSGDQISIQVDLKEEMEVPFAFFVKGSSISVNKKFNLSPCSLDCFSGSLEEAEIRGESGSISLRCGSQNDSKVIPLAGGDYFWGSDFLVVSKINSKSNNFIICF